MNITEKIEFLPHRLLRKGQVLRPCRKLGFPWLFFPVKGFGKSFKSSEMATEQARSSAASRHLTGNWWGEMKGWSSLFPPIFHQLHYWLQPLPPDYLAQNQVCAQTEMWQCSVFLAGSWDCSGTYRCSWVSERCEMVERCLPAELVEKRAEEGASFMIVSFL